MMTPGSQSFEVNKSDVALLSYVYLNRSIHSSVCLVLTNMLAVLGYNPVGGEILHTVNGVLSSSKQRGTTFIIPGFKSSVGFVFLAILSCTFNMNRKIFANVFLNFCEYEVFRNIYLYENFTGLYQSKETF